MLAEDIYQVIRMIMFMIWLQSEDLMSIRRNTDLRYTLALALELSSVHLWWNLPLTVFIPLMRRISNEHEILYLNPSVLSVSRFLSHSVFQCQIFHDLSECVNVIHVKLLCQFKTCWSLIVLTAFQHLQIKKGTFVFFILDLSTLLPTKYSGGADFFACISF